MTNKDPQNLIIKSRFVRQPPDKIRLLAKSLLGKKTDEAENILNQVPFTSARSLRLILKNGLNQAKDGDWGDNLKIQAIKVDEGPKLKRRRIIHRGRATAILKRMSHITMVFEGSVPKTIPPVKTKKEVKEGSERGA